MITLTSPLLLTDRSLHRLAAANLMACDFYEQSAEHSSGHRRVSERLYELAVKRTRQATQLRGLISPAEPCWEAEQASVLEDGYDFEEACGGGTGCLLLEAEHGEAALLDAYRVELALMPRGRMPSILIRHIVSVASDYDDIRLLKAACDEYE